MTLTKDECILLISTFNASIEHAMKSGFPIGEDYYNLIDSIKKKLYDELLKEGSRT